MLGGDLTVSGNDINLGNGATIVNTDGDTLTITEGTTAFTEVVTTAGNAGGDLSVSGDASVTGDLTVSGNDITLGNGATIVNTNANTLTITEVTTAFMKELPPVMLQLEVT